MSRAEVTTALTRIAALWLTDSFSYSAVSTEVGLPGSIRADVLSIDWSGNVRIIEIKSCRADFKGDSKWRDYLPHCDYFYFLAPVGEIDKKELPKGVGLLRPARPAWAGDWGPDKWRHVEVAKRTARQKDMDLESRLWILKRLAFRNSKIMVRACPHCGNEIVLSSAQGSPEQEEI